MIEVDPRNLEYYSARLRAGKPFAFSRFGNGEWGCILGTSKRTGSGSHTLQIPALRNGLICGIVTHQTDHSGYLLGMQSTDYLGRCGLLPKVDKWLANNAPEAMWDGGDVFHKASMKAQLNPLIRQLRGMKVIVVGPSWLRKLQSAFKISGFVEVPKRDCYLKYTQIRSKLFSEIRRLKGPLVISFSAGPPAKCLISDVYEKLGNLHYLIDFGSMWDPYCEVRSRRYHVRINAKVQGINLQT